MDTEYCFDKTNAEVRLFVTYFIIIAFFYSEWEMHIFISCSQQINLITACYPILDHNNHDEMERPLPHSLHKLWVCKLWILRWVQSITNRTNREISLYFYSWPLRLSKITLIQDKNNISALIYLNFAINSATWWYVKNVKMWRL